MDSDYSRNKKIFLTFLALFFILPILPFGWICRILFLGGCVYFYYNPDLISGNTINPLDSKQKTLITLIVYIMIGHVFHMGDAQAMADNTYHLTGSRMDDVFYRIVFNGLMTLLICFLAYSAGRKVARWHSYQTLLFKLYCGVAAVVILSNLITWGIGTGGIIGRYNYAPFLLDFGDIALFTIIALWLFWAFSSRWTLGILVFICIFNIVATGVRKYVGLVFIQVLLSCFYYFRPKLNAWTRTLLGVGSILALLGAAAMAFATGNQVVTGLVDPNNPDVFSRTVTIASAMEMFFANPLMGVGYGTFGARNTAVITYSGNDFILASPHNGLVAILAEIGVIGLGLVIWLVYLFLKDDFQALRNWHRFGRLEIAIALTSIGQILLAPLSNFTFIPPPSEFAFLGTSTILWFSAGFLADRIQANRGSEP